MIGGMLAPPLQALTDYKRQGQIKQINSPVMYEDPNDAPDVGETDKSGFGTQTHVDLNSPAPTMWQRYFDRMKYLGVDRIVPPNGALRGLKGEY